MDILKKFDDVEILEESESLMKALGGAERISSFEIESPGGWLVNQLSK